jgi:DNA-binding beta-propeller fold protein YncE
VDASDFRVLVANSGGAELLCFAGGGTLLWRHNLSGKLAPIGVTFDVDGNTLFAAMGTDTVFRLDPLGRPDGFISIQDSVRRMPGRLTVSSDGLIYIVDRRAQEILALAESGDVVATLSLGNDTNEKPIMVQDIVLGPFGVSAAVSALGPAVSLFDSTGTAIFKFGQHGGNKDEFSFPTAAVSDSLGRIWIVDSLQHQIKVFDAKGNHLFSFGEMGRAPGQFFFPIDVAFDSDGKLYVLEKMGERIQVFTVRDLEPVAGEGVK